MGKAWSKAWGTQPTAAMFETVHAFKGAGVEALHLVMCLRPEGCTVDQFRAAGTVLKAAAGNLKPCGPANNTRKALVGTGAFTETVASGSKPYAYVLKLTAKGAAVVKAAGKPASASKTAKASVPAKAAKKPASKPRKPTTPKVAVTPPVIVTAPAAPAVQVTPPVTA